MPINVWLATGQNQAVDVISMTLGTIWGLDDSKKPDGVFSDEAHERSPRNGIL